MLDSYTQNRIKRFQHQPSNRVSAYSLNQFPIEAQIRTKSRIHQNSSTKLTTSQQYILPKRGTQIRTLFAESEDQILSLFKIYFDLLGVKSQIMNSGNRYLFKYIQIKKAWKNHAAVVLDIRFKGVLGLYLATEKRENHDSQRIILVTATPKRYLPMEKLKAMDIKEKDILVLPFALSNLAEKLLHGSNLPRVAGQDTILGTISDENSYSGSQLNPSLSLELSSCPNMNRKELSDKVILTSCGANRIDKMGGQL